MQRYRDLWNRGPCLTVGLVAALLAMALMVVVMATIFVPTGAYVRHDVITVAFVSAATVCVAIMIAAFAASLLRNERA